MILSTNYTCAWLSKVALTFSSMKHLLNVSDTQRSIYSSTTWKNKLDLTLILIIVHDQLPEFKIYN